MNRMIIRNMRRALDACAEMDRRGLAIRSAHAHDGLPQIEIAEPPAGAFDTVASYTADGQHHCAALVDGVRVHWRVWRALPGRAAR